MEDAGDIVVNDPLAINIVQVSKFLLDHILSTNPSPPNHVIQLLQQASTGAIAPGVFLPALSHLLATQSYILSTLEAFRPLLVDLCARWLDDESIDEVSRLEALALILEIHEEIYPIVTSFLSRPSLAKGPLGFLLTEQTTVSTLDLHRILLLYFRLLHAEPDLPRFFSWPVEPLTAPVLLTHSDLGVRYLAIRCLAMHTRMAESERLDLENAHLGPLGEVDFSITCGDGKQANGWVFSVVEQERINAYRESIRDSPVRFYDPEVPPTLAETDLHPRVVSVSGVLMLRPSILPSIIISPLVPTPSSTKCIQKLALHLCRRLPTLLSGPPGSGKSVLIQHLAHSLSLPQEQIITIHLSDTSLDAKSLLGSYRSSSALGGGNAFEWVEGALVRAMREGRWLVFKDVDKASAEVLGTVMPLVESMRWSKGIGERAKMMMNAGGLSGEVEAADGFMLFATSSSSAVSASFLGAQHWYPVRIDEVTRAEQEIILATRFTKLRGSPLKALLRVWEAVQKVVGSSSKPAVSARDIGMRDLEKWVRRVDALLPTSFNSSTAMDVDESAFADIFTNPTLREEIYLEARDVFFGSWSSSISSGSAVALIGANEMGLTEERAKWSVSPTGRTPEYHVEHDAEGRVLAVCIGHIRVQSTTTASSTSSSSVARPFALHRPSLTLLSRLCSALPHAEPILLVGETGTGKTTSIQHIAHLLNTPLTVINLSQQTASADLIGGFKPVVDARGPAAELQLVFEALFKKTFSIKRNEQFLEEVRADVRKGKGWKRVVRMWKEARARAGRKLLQEVDEPRSSTDQPRKRRKVDAEDALRREWESFDREVAAFEVQHVLSKNKFVFTFVEGPLVKAVRQGHWVLLDEINLASSETLESITPLLQSSTSSITLTEQGSIEPVPRHPSFRIFASMNPATDVGKKDLPPNLRSRFTELWVPPPDDDKEALLAIVDQYIGHVALSATDRSAVMDVAEFYAELRRLADTRIIADGSNKKPHFSMRTLARALTFAAEVTPQFGLRRGIWEGCLMAFTMTLDAKSAKEIVTPLAEKWIWRGVKNVSGLLSNIPALPKGLGRDDVVQVGPFWLRRGPLPLQTAEEYVLTPSVQTKLIDLARIVLTRRFPVLIEGPTSAGKTSAIEYLAKRTGHRFVRINNHEHTDIQEYLGTYVSDPDTGKLVFRDGLLVRALREGHWIVLDELNLAPTDVLEALNRLLDDNRELVIPETQEIIKPHPSFMLFATQNPPGIYGGRKILSRAFRNRFLEVHFTDVPQAELEVILSERCAIPPSRAQRIVAVFLELQKRRQAGRVFETKQGFATLRDLFRWAGRDWKDKEGMGNQDLAEAGYMLLAERARRPDDKLVVKEVIEDVLKVRIDEEALYAIDTPAANLLDKIGLPVLPDHGMVWTSAFQRLFVLVSRALRHHEPVLLVGDTGSGKTSVCELFAAAHAQRLYTLNCHQNTETADLLGGQRPVRNRATLRAEAVEMAVRALAWTPTGSEEPEELLMAVTRVLDDSPTPALTEAQTRLKRLAALFEWHDGPLVEAMREGAVFLLDEISLADDSVLERLNSVLEPSRSLVLAEKGGADLEHVQVTAAPAFQLIATMNPGGDYGKKELSPALRNRFTEIWVPQVDRRADKLKIVNAMWALPELRTFGSALLDFCEWFGKTVGDESVIGLRDILAWVAFSNQAAKQVESVSPSLIFHHAARMTILDGLASLPQISSMSLVAIKALELSAVEKLTEMVPIDEFAESYVSRTADKLSIGYFGIGTGPYPPPPTVFNLQAPTTKDNAMRILRACQLTKPILLEGSPGVGKTSLVLALANVTGHRLHRINLSDQTDLMDLYGSDLPVEGGRPGEFVWKDASFLRALQDGDWVLLDEMNLAPQAVLEGLNAVLDHRGTVYIPELGRSFHKHPSFRIFAAQNPLHQGGGRKGLPRSFLNRFTKVYVQELSPADYFLVCNHLFPARSAAELQRIITFNARLHEEAVIKRTFGREGSPWEFNLRDILRWLTFIESASGLESHAVVADYARSVYVRRFRNVDDRQRVWEIFSEVFEITSPDTERPWLSITPTHFQIGHFLTERIPGSPYPRQSPVLHSHLPSLEAMADALRHSSLVIVSGRCASGKTTLVRQTAALSGVFLHEFAMHPAVDTADLLGSFEQLVGPPQGSAEEGDSAASAKQGALLALAGAGRFEWVDGPLVTAVKEGRWLLLDNANLCSPSVLDRLNSLCETGGSLMLSERGLVNGEVQILTPHPNFRLFMVLDPRHGELSRAMRNRGIEITIDSPSEQFDQATISSARRSASTYHITETPSTIEALRRGLSCPNLTPDTQVSFTFSPSNDFYSASISHQLRLCRAIKPRDTPQVIAVVEYVLRSSSLDQLSLLRHAADLFTPYIIGELRSALDLIPQDALRKVATISADRLYLRGVPSTFLRFQPIDILLNPNLSECEDDFPVPASTVSLRVVELLVSRAYEMALPAGLKPTTVFSRSHGMNLHHLLSDGAPKGVQELYPMISAITREVDDIARHLSFMTVELLPKVLHTLSTLHVQAQYLKQTTSKPEFDYSAVATIMVWIKSTLEESEEAFPEIRSAVNAMAQSIALTTGHGMQPIWESVLRPVLPFNIAQELARLDELCSRIKPAADVIGIRRNALDLMSIASLDISKLGVVLDDVVSANVELEKHRDTSKETSSIDGTEIVMKQSMIFAIPMSNRTRTYVANLIQLAIRSPAYPVSHLTPWQQWLWTMDATRSDDEIPASLQTTLRNTWFRSLWNVPGYNSKAQGPTHLMNPILIQQTITEHVLSGESLDRLVSYENRLHRQASFAAMAMSMPAADRSHSLVAVLCDSLVSLLKAFRSLYNIATFRNMVRLISEWRGDPYSHGALAILDALQAFISSSTDNIVSNSLVAFVAVLKELPQTSSHLSSLSKSFIALGQAIILLYVPDAPIDPVVSQRCTTEFWTGEATLLDARIAVNVEAERLQTGNHTNPTLVELSHRRREAQDRLEAVQAPGTGRLPNITRLHALHVEIAQFCAEVIGPTPVDSFVRSIELDSEQGPLREEVIQGSIAGFLQRLDSAYADHDDITRPFINAVELIRFGIRSLVHSQTILQNDSTATLFHAAAGIASFPSTLTIVHLEEVAFADLVRITMASIKPAQWLVFELDIITHDSKATSNLHRHLGTLIERYDQLLRLWVDDREKEKKEASEANSLYRQAKQDETILTDEEVEDKEFRRLFPRYDGEGEPEQEVKNTPSNNSLDPELHHTIFKLHTSVFCDAITGNADILPESARVHLLSRIVQLPGLSHSLDDKTASYRLLFVSRLIAAMGTRDPDDSEIYDFYRSSNVPEARRVVDLLEGFMGRVQEILSEWPDQMVLVNLFDKAQDILRLGIHSPVAQLLSALERLLLQTDDWERYAHKGNSLGSQQQLITSRIVEWRRLELSCWAQLLEAQAREFGRGVDIWWFRLYESIVQATASAAESLEPGAVDSHLQHLSPLLDRFIVGSSLGQFARRMSLLSSFSAFVRAIVPLKDGTLGAAFARLAAMLRTTRDYWAQFEEMIEKHLAKEKDQLDKTIRDFIKLASWRDINVHALKASAEKTHRQLHACIRKFRSILQQPVEPLITGTAYESGGAERDVLAATMAEPSPDLTARLTPPLDGEISLIRLTALVHSKVRPFAGQPLYEPLDQLAVDIISTSQSLASTAIVGATAESKAKFAKELVSRKRKALADIMKELRDLGLPHNVKPEVLAQQQSRPSLMELEGPEHTSPFSFGEHLSKAETYHHRLNHLMPQLRQAMSKHHADISTRDLQRALTFVESSFAMALNSRQQIRNSLSVYSKLEQTTSRLRSLLAVAESHSTPRQDESLKDELDVLCQNLGRLSASLAEVQTAVSTFASADLDAAALLPPCFSQLRDEIDRSKAAVLDIRTLSAMTHPPFLLPGEITEVDAGYTAISKALETLDSWAEEHSEGDHLFRTVIDWLKSTVVPPPVQRPASTDSAVPSAEPLANAVLIVTQNLLSHAEGTPDDPMDDFIRQHDRSLRRTTDLLRLETLSSLVGQFVMAMARSSTSLDAHYPEVRRSVAFLDQYLAIAHDHLIEHSRWCRTSYKLAFVLCTITQTLASKGFCKPQESDESDKGGQNGEGKLEEGTGLGAGEGQENISDQIEDESQVEGLQGEEELPRDKEERQDADDDKAIEMGQDFEGGLEDVEEKDGDGSQSDGDEGEEEGPEDQVGDLDPLDPNAVDEKLWGDEKGPEDQTDTQDQAKDRSTNADQGDSEMTAREDDNGERKPDDPDEDRKDGEKMEEGGEDETEEAQGPDLDNNVPDQGARMDDHVPEADTLDLPEDLKLDGGEEMGGDEMEVEDELEDDLLDELDVEDDGKKHPDQAEDGDGDVDPDLDAEGKKEVVEAADEDEEQNPDSTPEDLAAAPKADDDRDAAGDAAAADLDERGDGADGSGQRAAGVKADDRPAPDADQPEMEHQNQTAIEPTLDDQNHGDDTAEGEASGQQQQTEAGETGSDNAHPSIPNPLRNLGDAMKEIRRRFQEISDPTTAEEQQGADNDAQDDNTQLEYLQQDNDAEDMQALGPAGPEEATRLRDLRISDDEPSKTGPPPTEDLEMADDIPIPMPNAERLPIPETARMNEAGIEHALTDDQIRGDVDMVPVDEVPSDEDPNPSRLELPSEKQEVENAEVELQLRQWMSDGQPTSGAEALWRQYDHLTQDLSSHLCEQLRLILEPTLATRLKGDYRTGKRLNMKKIIPYIASEFTKDKIWLRRTRPSQREYQVLIALDDSKSMAESHSVHLAYETLALVTKALSRLEVGDVGVVKFGKTVDVLHAFDDGTPFSDAVGAKTISAFRFDQPATDVFALVETSIKVLTEARERKSMAASSSAAGELWQLEIIISDGICQDHERLRATLRKAEEQRIMIVFVIVDSLKRQSSAAAAGKENSILSMNQVSYKNINGRMELQMERYLDTFPFEYYVVLRNVEALPEVLSGTLKQFFERSSEI